MYDLDIYNTKTIFNNMVYSIDKIRLKTYITGFEFSKIEGFFNNFHKDKIKRFWISDKKSSFHFNYNIEIEEGKSFIFQFMHNSESINFKNEILRYNFSIEFNPNKIKDNNLLLYILNSFSNWFLRSFDLAIDIPINILDILIDKSKKRSYKCFSSGSDNITYYLGTKERDGNVKIYNKKIESNLNIVGSLTRVEITRKYDDFDLKGIKNFDFGNQFPILFLNQYCFSFSDYTTADKTLLAILYAVQSGYPLNNLSRRYREKVESLLKGGSSIEFNQDIANKVLLQCIFYYFVREGSKQIIM